jgi:hypothetical protein
MAKTKPNARQATTEQDDDPYTGSYDATQRSSMEWNQAQHEKERPSDLGKPPGAATPPDPVMDPTTMEKNTKK